ncbi:MAG: hypothetical protein CMH32_02480 [Micavibrio sp.]|nr:hypothetical protein [Micavibrio sp.]HCK32946.1 hypothetical protein [Rhodospirillaceae bacterium]
MPSSSQSQTSFPWITTLAILIAVTVLLSLGTWQVKRLAWKETLIAQIDAAYKTEAENFDAQAIYEEFDKVTFSGSFIKKAAFIRSKTHDGKVGYHLIMPLKTSNGTIFVNRGWIETDAVDMPQTKTKVQFDAVLREATKSNPFIPDNTTDGPYLYWPEISKLETIFGIKSAIPMIAWQIPTQNDLARQPYPVGDKPVLKNDHLQYAIFWFTMAFILVVIGAIKMRSAARKAD